MVKKAIKCESNGVVVYSSQSCHRSGKERLVEKLGQKWIISGSHNFPILKIFFYIKNPPPTILKHWWLLPLWQAESGNLREWKFWENNFSSKTQYWTGKCFQRVKMKTLYNVMYMYMYIVHSSPYPLFFVNSGRSSISLKNSWREMANSSDWKWRKTLWIWLIYRLWLWLWWWLW